MKQEKVLIVGLGQVGKALFEIAKGSGVYGVSGIDKDSKVTKADYLHICIPYSEDFVSIVLNYVKDVKPKLTFIHSTVLPGTTKLCMKMSRYGDIVYSPVRGQHSNLQEDLARYTEYMAHEDMNVLKKASLHLFSLGLRTRSVNKKPENLELVKLLDTTQYGILIGWAQEAERICEKFDADHALVREFGEETQEFYGVRPKITPGVIGGTCVIPNIELLLKIYDSKILKYVLESNKKKSGGSKNG